MKHTHRYLSSILALTTLFFATSIPAFATFPGKNGRIAFINGPDIYTMNPDGSDVKQLTNLGPDNSALWESWSPDGKHIVFNEFPPPDGFSQIWVMNADGTNQHLLLAESDFGDERPSFTPDGSAVVFSRCYLDIDQGCAIYQIGLAGGTPTAITSFELGIQDRSPQYSSSGHLAFTGIGRGGLITAIYLKTRDGDEARRLTPAELTLRQPDWSPDGNRIAGASHNGTPQNEEIWIVDADGDGLRQLTNNGIDYFNGPHDLHPSWSPQGDAIVFERDAPDFSSSAIFIMNHDGTGCRRLANLHPSPPANLVKRPESLRPIGAHQAHHLAEIEQGGALPQWGPAAN